MEYSKFEKLGISTSLLGFGCMRFPQTPDGKIDEPEAEKMLDTAIKAGVTYIDTAYPYHNGDSEPFVGKVLKKYDRDSFYLATKLPIWKLEKKEDVKRIFDEQLERLAVDHVDFYLLHGLDKEAWEKVKELDVLPFVESMREAGKIRYIGFSFHDDYEVFEEILTSRPWDFCQIQLNYYDRDYQAGIKGMKMAAERGMAVVVMEPLRGGLLVDLPKNAQAVFDESGIKHSNVEWAFDWLWDMPEVSCVLSGMSTPEQLQQNIGYMQNAHPGMLSDEERKVLDQAKAALDSRAAIPCTGCNYCVDMCPNKIAIPYNFRAYNMGTLYDDMELAKDFYQNEVTSYGRRADSCTSCGSCEEICPQHIAISEWLPKVDELLGE